MVRILAIGNSFSQDATTYLHDMARCGGIETKVVNLYIGGCSLQTHWGNAESDRGAYDYQLNGSDTGKKVSIRQALLEENWDFVTLQQASHDSGIWQTYEPYLGKLSEYVRRHAPHAVQLIHQTWAYEIGSTHPAFEKYGRNQEKMAAALRYAYRRAAEEIHADVIPCGDVIQALRGLKEFDCRHGGQSLCRDGFHMHLVYGRYATAATWYEAALAGNMLNNGFVPPGGKTPVRQEWLRLIAQTVHAVCSRQPRLSRPA